jgi:hypothetical protein
MNREDFPELHSHDGWPVLKTFWGAAADEVNVMVTEEEGVGGRVPAIHIHSEVRRVQVYLNGKAL